jgi:DNA-binding transcriptional LysR family regulator
MPSSLARRLRAGEFDLAVVFDFPAAGEDIGAGLEFHHLLDVPFDIVLHPSHRLAGRQRVGPEDLAEEDWLLPDFGPESPSLKLIGRLCAAAGFEPRVAFKVNDCHMTQAMVAAGEGVSILPRLLLDPNAGVVAKAIEGDAPAMRVGVVRQPTRYFAPATAAFLAVLEEAAKRRADSWGRRRAQQRRLVAARGRIRADREGPLSSAPAA